MKTYNNAGVGASMIEKLNAIVQEGTVDVDSLPLPKGQKRGATVDYETGFGIAKVPAEPSDANWVGNESEIKVPGEGFTDVEDGAFKTGSKSKPAPRSSSGDSIEEDAMLGVIRKRGSTPRVPEEM